MPEIRAVLDQARAMAGREDTNDFALEAPRLLAQLVEALDLYVGHEPTLAEEHAYVSGEVQRQDTAITEALRLLESAPEAFAGGSQNIAAAAHVLRQASGDAAGEDTREVEPAAPAPRERVFTHRWADTDEPHLTIRLTFGPEYTDAGIEEITARIRAAARHGYRDAEQTEPAAPAAPAAPAPDFFQPGRLYVRDSHGHRAQFHVTHISTAPDQSDTVAVGWTRIDGYDTWRDYSTDDFDGWTETTEDGAR